MELDEDAMRVTTGDGKGVLYYADCMVGIASVSIYRSVHGKGNADWDHETLLRIIEKCFDKDGKRLKSLDAA